MLNPTGNDTKIDITPFAPFLNAKAEKPDLKYEPDKITLSAKEKTVEGKKSNAWKWAAGIAGAALAALGAVIAIKKHNFKRELTEIYGNVWRDMCENNPLIGKMNMSQAKLKFGKLEERMVGQYYLGLHTCTIDLSQFKKYKFIALGANGNIRTINSSVIHSAEEIERMRKKGLLEGFSVIKLTKNEQKLFIAAIISHELRHSVQFHTLLHTNGIGKEEILKWARQGIPEEKLSYIVNYNAGCYLEENVRLICPLKTKDGKQTFLTSKDHFWKALQDLSSEGYKKMSDMYFGNPLEIDANAFESTFYRNPKYSQNCREIIINALAKQPLIFVNKGIEVMKELGYRGFEVVKN
jgi:hypothetical protein